MDQGGFSSSAARILLPLSLSAACTQSPVLSLRARRLRRPLPSNVAIAPSAAHAFCAPSAEPGNGSNAAPSELSCRDTFREVAVTADALRRLRLVSGGWARLWLPADGAEPAFHPGSGVDPGAGAPCRLCRIIVWEPPATKDVRRDVWPPAIAAPASDEALLPPSLAFNIGVMGLFPQRVCLQRWDGFAGDDGGGSSSANFAGSGMYRWPLPQAREARIARVVVPGREPNRNYARALSAFFGKPRLLCAGDIFSIPVPTSWRGCMSGTGGGSGGSDCGDGDEGDAEESCGSDDEADAAAGGVDSDEQRFRAAVRARGAELAYFRVTCLRPAVGDAGGDSPVDHDGGYGAGVGGGGGGFGGSSGRVGCNENAMFRCCMVVSRAATTLVQSGAVRSAVPEPAFDFPFTCLAAGHAPPPKPVPSDETAAAAVAEVLAPLTPATLPPPPATVLGPQPQDVTPAAASVSVSAASAAATAVAAAGLALGVRPAVLLLGPRGGGKAAALRAGAAAAGWHVHEVRFRAVAGAGAGAPAAMVAAAREAVAAAAAAAPCVLYLGAVASAAGSMGSAGGRAPPGAAESDARFAEAVEAALAEFGGGAGGGYGGGGGSGGHDGSAGLSGSGGGDHGFDRRDFRSKLGVGGSSGASIGGRDHGDHGGGYSGILSAPAWRAPPVVLAAAAVTAGDVPPPLRRLFTHEVAVTLPDDGLRLRLVEHCLGRLCLGSDVDAAQLAALAKRLVGRSAADVRALAALAGQMALDAAAVEAAAADAAVATAAAAAGAEVAAAPPVDWLSMAEAAEAAVVECWQCSGSTAATSPAAGPDAGGGAHWRGTAPAVAAAGVASPPNVLSGPPVVTLAHIRQAEKQLPPPTSSMRIGCPKVPEVHWEDVGGLSDVRGEIGDIIDLPLRHPEVFATGVRRRSGILLYGPPGTGKTLIAKCIATECGLPFFSVKGPELLDMYVGESERNVREVFRQAAAAAPCVLFFDELDSLAPARGRGADSGGVMDRVVAQLLSELDGAAEGRAGGGGSSNGDGGGVVAGQLVFVIGATNRPDLLDPSLLRPGRFDRLLYLGTSGDVETQMKVLRAITRKFSFEPGVDMRTALAGLVTPAFTGADLSAVASNALQAALKRRVAAVEAEVAERNAKEFYGGPVTVQQVLARMTEEELTVRVSSEDLRRGAAAVTPSVSREELRHYERLRREFSSLAGVPASPGGGGGGGRSGGGDGKSGGGSEAPARSDGRLR